MATIYRFVVEGKGGSGGNGGVGNGKNIKTPKGKGVEYNRYQRITTTFGNKATGGMYSQSLRNIKAIKQFARFEKGEYKLNGVSIVILIQTILRIASAITDHYVNEATRYNSSNMKKLEVGKNQISGNFKTSYNWFTGKATFNENK